jgi:hypothetical protein
LPQLLWHVASFYFGLIRRTAPFSRLLRHARGCGGPQVGKPFLHVFAWGKSTTMT